MEHLVIAKTDDTPEIDFNPGTKELKISGRSLPEDVTTFYAPVLEWLDELEESAIGELKFIVNLEYFNTASSKLILDILMKLEDIHSGGSYMLYLIVKSNINAIHKSIVFYLIV